MSKVTDLCHYYKYRHPELLYVLSVDGDPTVCKIGRTNHIKKRLANLQAGAPGKLTVVKTWEGLAFMEKEILQALDSCTTGGKEWRRSTPAAVVDLIDELALQKNETVNGDRYSSDRSDVPSSRQNTMRMARTVPFVRLQRSP